MYFDNLVFTFFVFSLLGYICETIFCSIGQRKLANRGFLYGPCLPIYGFGGLIIKICLVPFADKGVWGGIIIFVLGVVLTSCVEYFGSWLLEKFFSIKLWDYSKNFMNIHGRVCLRNSTLFGIMGLVTVYIVEPPLNDFINGIPVELRRAVCDLIIVVFVVDFTLSCMKMAAFKNALQEVREKRKELEERTAELKAMGKEEAAKAVMESLSKSLESSIEKAKKHSKKILSSFPSATSPKEEIRGQLDRLKAMAEDARKQIRDEKKRIKEDMKKTRSEIKDKVDKVKDKIKNKDE